MYETLDLTCLLHLLFHEVAKLGILVAWDTVMYDIQFLQVWRRQLVERWHEEVRSVLLMLVAQCAV